MNDPVTDAYQRVKDHDPAALNAVALTLSGTAPFMPLRQRYGVAVLVVEALDGKPRRGVTIPTWAFWGLAVLAVLDLTAKLINAIT